MISVGIAGIGFMGMIHYLSYQKVRGVKVIHLCEQNRKRLNGDWTSIKGNFGPAGTKMDLSGIRKSTELGELFRDPELDMVDICLPPAFHADAAVGALRSEKHVFCEKPMALTAAGTRKMVRASEKSGKLLMIGHVLPLLPEYQFALKAVESGKYGALLGGSFRRVISDPDWIPNFYDPDQIGGPMLDLHVHDAHFIRLLFGMPTSVTSQGRMRGEVAEYFNTQFSFSDPAITVSATSGVINQPGRSFNHGYEIHFERATMLFEFAVFDDKPVTVMPMTVIPDRGKVRLPKLGSGDMLDAFQTELRTVASAVRTNKCPTFLSANLARDAITLCHRQTQSVKSGKTVKLS